MEKIPLFSKEELSKLTMPVLYLGGDKDALLDTLATAEVINRFIQKATGE